MKQIILVTDGCSNEGISPAAAAAQARSEDLIVNVIGIVDGGDLGERGAQEIVDIARAGGGMSRIVSSRQLAQTIQMMTRKTAAHTIRQVVSRELQQIFGHSSIESLHPDQRAQVVQVIDDLGETADLQVALLIDTSASMKPKLRAVEDAIRDLLLSLRARKGLSEIAVFHFPGRAGSGCEIEMDTDWTRDLANLNKLFYKLNMKGTTPTGPALLRVVRFFASGAEALRHDGWTEIAGTAIGSNVQPAAGKDGMLGDYVV